MISVRHPAQIRRTRIASGRRIPARALPAMPVFINLYDDSERFTAIREDRDGAIAFLQTRDDKDDSELGQFFDVYALRDSFFRVRTPEDALEFLQQVPEFVLWADDNGAAWPERQRITWHDFQHWQGFFKAESTREGARGNNPHFLALFNWKAGEPYRFTDREIGTLHGGSDVGMKVTHNAAGNPQIELHVECWSVTEAIAATIHIDKLSGVENVICKGCATIFDRFAKDGHRRSFCEPACGKRFHKRKEQNDAKIKRLAKASVGTV